MSTPRVEAKSQPVPTKKPSKAVAAAPVSKSAAGPSNGNSAQPAAQDKVTLSEGGVDLDQANQRKLSQFAATQGRNGAAETTVKLESPGNSTDVSSSPTASASGDSAPSPTAGKVPPKAGTSEYRWGQADRKMKAASGAMNLYQGAQDISEGNYKKGGCEVATGLAEEAQVCGSQLSKMGSKLSKVGAKLPAAVSAKLASIGSTAKLLADGGGVVLSFAGAGINGYECYDAYKKGDTLTAVEKGVDTAASGVSALASLPMVTTAAERALISYGATKVGALAGAGGLTAAAGLCTIAAATGYSLGRAAGSAGLDSVAQGIYTRAFFDQGNQSLRATEANNAAATSISSGWDNEQLKYQLKGDPGSFVRAIQGNLDRIEAARAGGDKAAGMRAQNELARLRAVQRGEV